MDSHTQTIRHSPDELAALVAADEKLVAQKRFEAEDLIEVWADQTRPALLSVSADTEPRMLIRYIGADMLQIFRQARILDRFDVFDVPMNYWNEKLQDDIYILKASGFNAGREIEYVYGTKKAKDAGETIAVEDTGKVKSFDGVLIPASLIESEYFVSDQVDLTAISSKIAQIEAELETILEDQPEEDNLFTEVLSSTGKVIEKQLNARIAALLSLIHI